MNTTRQPAAATPIALLACGARDSNVLELIIQRFLGGEFVIVAPSAAEMAIIDGDTAASQKSMTEWRQRQPHAFTLVLTLQPGEDTQELAHFRKPIDVDALVAVLKKARTTVRTPVAAAVTAAVRPAPIAGRAAPVAPVVKAQTVTAAAAPAPVLPVATAAPASLPRPMPVAPEKKIVQEKAAAKPNVTAMLAPEPINAHQVALVNERYDIEGRDYCGSAEDLPAEMLHGVDCLRPDQAIQLYFDPEARLLGLLRLAGKLAKTSQQATCIRGLERPLLVLPDEPMTVLSPIKDSALRALCNTSLFSETVGLASAAAAHPEDNTYRYDELLWKVTLWTARGRLPRGADPHQAVRLHSAPDFSRFTATPYAESICRLWQQEGGLSPVATATRLHIAQRYVFALYSALRMLDLVDLNPHSHRVGEAAATAYSEAVKTAPPKSRRGLLQGILTKLDNAA